MKHGTLVTVERIKCMYEMLAECPPFDKWNMPDSDDVIFKVTRNKTTMGHHVIHKETGKPHRHEIAISRVCCGWLHEAIRVMAHEMLHLHQEERGMGSPHNAHNAAFVAEAKIICDCLGFDPHTF